MSIIHTAGLTKFYGRSRGIIDVNLDINEGEIFGFIGPNGAGKSTTIRTLLSFIRPTNGSANIFGLDCLKRGDVIKRDVGYISSDTNYYDDMKVKDLLMYSAAFYKKDCSKRIGELTDIFEVETNKRINSLSTGNKRKVAIVQAMLHEPRLLILDEPTGGLDPLMQNRFFEVLRQENKRGVTVFFSSHILNEVQKLCDRVAIIKEGCILKIEQVDKLTGSRFKRIKVEFGNPSDAADLGLPGITDIKSNGNIVEFLYGGRMGDMLSKLSGRAVENLWVEEPSLEEVFMHYYEKEAV